MLAFYHKIRAIPPRRLAILIIAVGLVWQGVGAWQDSQTTDEAVHLASGYIYWQDNRYNLNPEHPPLFKRLAALPLFATQALNIDRQGDVWQSGNQWVIAGKMIYGTYDNLSVARWLIFVGRLPMIFIWAVLAWVLYAWPRQRWGEQVGLLSLTFFTFDPNFLGHGHLITNDVAMSLALVGVAWALERFLVRPRWTSLAWLAVIFGLAQVTKFSAVALWLLVPAVVFIQLLRKQPIITWNWWWRMMAGLVICTGLITWVSYGFEVTPPLDDPRLQSALAKRDVFLATPGLIDRENQTTQYIIRASDPNTFTGRVLQQVIRWPVPFYSYYKGLVETYNHNYWGHAAFFLGQSSEPDNRGWRLYFPVGMAIKMPPLTLILTLTAIIYIFIERWRQRRQWSFFSINFWTFVFIPLAWLAFSMTSHINIGVRHAFPVYVFIFPLLASLAVKGRAFKRVRWSQIVTVAAILNILVAAKAWPNTIGYFSGLVGGTNHGHAYLLDSNLDWNQDLWRLRSYLDKESFSEVHLAVFGSVPSSGFFPDARAILTDPDIAAGVKPQGIVVTSAGMLYDPNVPLHWLRSYQPIKNIGSSIYVYDFN